MPRRYLPEGADITWLEQPGDGRAGWPRSCGEIELARG